MKYLIKKYRILLAILILPYIFIIVICTYKTDKEITMVGNISEVQKLIKLDTDNVQEGSFNSVYVYTTEHTTILQNYIAPYIMGNDVSDISQGYVHLTDAQTRQMGVIQKNQSIEASLIKAYTYAHELDDSINITYEFKGYIIRYITALVDKVQLGDIIEEVDGVSYLDGNDALKNAINNSNIGSILKIRRNSNLLEVTWDENHYKQVSLYEKYSINYQLSTPAITINKASTVGPSAGLLQTLSIFNQLTDYDYTKGLKIAGTGTIDVNGNVGKIGGIKQKIIAAYQNNVDIFLCPSSNYEDALKAYNTLKNKNRMKLIEVSTFESAIGALCQ